MATGTETAAVVATPRRWTPQMPQNLKQMATVITWIVGTVSFLFWLGVIEPIGQRYDRDRDAMSANIRSLDERQQKMERAIIDLQYSVKSIESMSVQLSSIGARIATMELRLAQQGKP